MTPDETNSGAPCTLGDPRGAVLLDRDVTVCRSVHYLAKAHQFELLPNVGSAIRRLNAVGIPVVVVTNQSGLSRGLFTLTDLQAVHGRMHRDLATLGATLAAEYYCPHLPEDGCECRKPKAGMLKQAALNLSLGLSSSYMVGDKLTDIGAGQAAGCRTILLGDAPGEYKAVPDRHVCDLPAAVATILREMARPMSC